MYFRGTDKKYMR